jgi:hypothetical protein
VNLGTSADHFNHYFKRADSIPHRGEDEPLEFIPANAHRILDLGTGTDACSPARSGN